MSTANSPKTRKDPLGYKPQRDILTMIGRYHYVTSRQVTRLLFRDSIHNYSQKLLAELTRAGYLTDINWIPKENKSPGRPEFVWSLTSKGRTALQDMGEPIEIKITHSPEKSQLFMLHTQAINDTLITAELFAREQEAVFLSGFEHELSLKRRAIKVPTTQSKDSTVTPDAWLHLTINDRPGALMIEVDRGTEDRTKWQTKARDLLTLIAGRASLYSQHFGGDPVQIAVVIRSTASYRIKTPEKRLTDLLLWTEAVLADKQAWAPYFAMTAVDPLSVSPTLFFTGTHWFSPFTRRPRSLIPPERLKP